MTALDCLNGTERCHDAMHKVTEKYDFVVNIQGDEPFIQPEQIDLVVSVLYNSTDFEVATLVKRINTTSDLFNPNIVKAVLSVRNEALYFSRQALPFMRGVAAENWCEKHIYYKHIGLYAYKTDVLARLVALKPSVLENVEALEQLRWLENGIKIGAVATTIETFGIDTPEDLAKALQFLVE
jgi:3-deoxy-manno-octulosonate cytidylyltransferase (CMP-KDO synthetase)